MCNTLTGASIWGWLEIFAYLTLTAVSVVGYQQATEHWGIKNQIISLNGIEVDQATLSTIGIVLGSVGLLCSLMLVIGVAKRCRLMMLPWLLWVIAIIAINTLYAVYIRNVLLLSMSVVPFIIWCLMVSLYQQLEKYEIRPGNPITMVHTASNPYNKFTGMA